MTARTFLLFAAAALLAAGCVPAGPSKAVEQESRMPRLSRGEEGAIRDRIKRCWNIDVAAPVLPVVTLRVTRVKPDGTVSPDTVSIVDDGGNPDVARNAVRAVLNPLCQPWPTPQGGWPDGPFTLVFDPRGL
ncbi:MULTISPECIES: cell envelope integrity protein TolA [unclassified Inquilinus]|uniref:cell envelope integrity protein TolA n=1 Tax=unclassified Inquilinus TaxID=2645927 RepID=UPI003F907CB0